MPLGQVPGASQPPRGFVNKLFPTVPKHPMQNLWHAIKPEFLAEGVASVSQDRRRGAGSTPVSTAPLPPSPALGSPIAPLFCDPLATLPRAELICSMGVDFAHTAPPGPDGVGCTVMTGRGVGLAALKGHAYFDGPQALDAESLA